MVHTVKGFGTVHKAQVDAFPDDGSTPKPKGEAVRGSASFSHYVAYL